MRVKRGVIKFVKPVLPVVAVAGVNTSGQHELPARGGEDSDHMRRSGERLVCRAGRVWATLSLAGLAVVVLWTEVLSAWFIYDRGLILQGHWWRGWTGHVVHFGSSHLLWDLAVLLPAGCWLELAWPKLARWFYVGCPLAISAGLLVLEPGLLRYAGLSGLATGVLVLLAGLQLRLGQRSQAWLWWGVLGLVGTKLGYDLLAGAPMLVDLGGEIRSVTWAHGLGALSGLVGWVAVRPPGIIPPSTTPAGK